MRWLFPQRTRTRSGRALLGWVLVALLLTAVFVRAAEKLPPAPKRYFNDYAGVVPAETAAALDARLAAFERESSNQILVAVFPKLETDSSMEDFTQRTAEAWRAGDAKRNNGAILFVFVADRKMRIEVGYGLEGALPDATAKRIIAEEIAPAFRTGNYAQGLTAGVDAMIKATRGEYTALPKQRHGTGGGLSSGWLCLIFALLMAFNIFRSTRNGTVYNRNGRRNVRGGGWTIFPPMGGGGGGGGFGGGGFSGGGGSFGGGGASGDW